MTARELVVTASFKNLARIGDFVMRVAIEAGFDDKAIYDLQVAVDEACTNIIEHAYGGERDEKPIRLVCELQANGVRVIIYDQGQQFDPTSITPLDTAASLEERSTGGMGVFLMRQLVDEVAYTFDTAEGNRLILSKRHPPD